MLATTSLWPIVTKTDGMSVRADIMYIGLVRVFLSSGFVALICGHFMEKQHSHSTLEKH